ncbi:MAG TPA: IclR family transcriptional regulator [Natronosporangium sp.]|nr:IclR family transcriptional regulator [Natronosporangium sp.]
MGVTGSNHRNLTADRAIQLLLLYDDDRPVLTAAEVAERLGMSRSTTYRYLQSLRAAGMLEEDARGFRLGMRIFQLAHIARKGLGLSEVALPVMRRLAEQTGETVLLTRRVGHRVVCLEREESTHHLRLSYERGQILPIHAGASGLVLLAWLTAQELDEVLRAAPLEQFTPSTTTDPQVLRARLAEIRKVGYCVTFGERDPGVVGVAAPVRGRHGAVVAGLSVVMPQPRMDVDMLQSTIDLVTTSAEEIGAAVRLIDS